MIYPHVNFWIHNVEDAVRVAAKVPGQNPAWDMLLELFARELEHQRLAPGRGKRSIRTVAQDGAVMAVGTVGGPLIGICRNHGRSRTLASTAFAQKARRSRQSPSGSGGGSPAAASRINVSSSSLLFTCR